VVRNADEIIFFLGAGASKPFGILTMKELTQIIKTDLTGDVLFLYENILDNLLKDGNKEIDIECILSIIQYILYNKNNNVSDVLNFYLFKNKQSNHLRNEYNIFGLTELEQKLFNSIRRYCTRASNVDHVYDVYSNFFNIITGDLGGSYYTDSVIKCDDSWTIFTTNYDIILESLWKEYNDKRLFAGFICEKFSPDLYLYTSNSDVYRKTWIIK
jgi:hypothetical protein